MANTKKNPNKAENKAISIALSAHKDLIERIEWNTEGEGFEFVVTTTDDEAFRNADLEQSIADALAHMQEEHPEETAEADDEAETQAEGGKTIVPKRYRDEYKARGNARHNSDWFALTMASYCNAEGKKAAVLLERVYAIALANGVDKTWPTLNNGQQRMNAGNAIRRKVLTNGFLTIPALVTGTEELKLEASDWVKEVAERAAAKKAA